MKIQSNPKYGAIATVLLVAPLILVLGIESIARGSLWEAYTWAVYNYSLFALNALLVMLALITVYCLVGSLMPSVATTALLVFLMAMISFFKTKLIGEPFFPWDIFLNKEAMNIAPFLTNEMLWIRIVPAAALVIAIFVLRLFVPRLSLRWMQRVVLGSISLILLHGFFVNAGWAEKVLWRAGASEIVWNQQSNYSQNGLVTAFTMNAKNAIVTKPPGYGEASIGKIAQTMQDFQSVVPAAVQSEPTIEKKPNVIFIMNESFWDPTLLPGVFFRTDPIPTVHRLQEEGISGYMLSPQFGGGTSNVEFEILTGNSMSFLPAGSVPYQQYVKKPLPSLASYFAEQGYRSIGIHPYEPWFWDRTTAYKQLGFESFQSQEQFNDPEYRGDFISDDEVSRAIIKEVDESEQPLFIYAVTMQNHGPYDNQRYTDNRKSFDIEGDLTDEAFNILHTYAIGASDADGSLQMLIDHFERSDEPTVIVFFGDHLPMLGLDYDVYVQGGFVEKSRTEEWSLEESKRMHSVPFVIWSNMELPANHIPTISASFLGSYVLDVLNMKKPALFEWNWNVFRQTPGLLRNLVVDADQKLHRSLPASLEPDIDHYRLLQYDLLFGSRFIDRYY